MPRAKRPSCDRCGRRRQPPCRPASRDEQDLARLGLRSLRVYALRVSLIPAPRPNFIGHKIRVVDDTNPAWYREVYARRGRGAKMRQRVIRALRSVAAGCVRRQWRAMDDELLEALDLYDDLGPGGRPTR